MNYLAQDSVVLDWSAVCTFKSVAIVQSTLLRNLVHNIIELKKKTSYIQSRTIGIHEITRSPFRKVSEVLPYFQL